MLGIIYVIYLIIFKIIQHNNFGYIKTKFNMHEYVLSGLMNLNYSEDRLPKKERKTMHLSYSTILCMLIRNYFERTTILKRCLKFKKYFCSNFIINQNNGCFCF